MNALSRSDGNVKERPFRVLHVFLFFQPDFTGEGLYLAKLAPLLAELGVRSDVVIAARTPGETPPIPGIDSVFRLVEPGVERLWGHRRFLRWMMANARRYDVVHFHCQVDRLLLSHMVARLSGCRVIQSATLDDGLGMVADSYDPSDRWLVRRLLGLISHTVAISPRLYEDSLRVASKQRVSLIPQGVMWQRMANDPEKRAEARAAFGLAPDDFVLLFVGGLCARKDVMFLLDAMPLMAHPDARVRLLVVGPDLEPDYARAVRRRAAALGDGTVLFTGYLEDPSSAYFAADIFVFASHQEGFGNVLIEAMAAGLPIVARRLPGVTDSFITDGKSGLLFSDATGYAYILERLMRNPALRLSIGNAARAATADYDLAEMARRYAAIYRGKSDVARTAAAEPVADSASGVPAIDRVPGSSNRP